MASIVSYNPQGIIDKALFNFDAMGRGLTDFKLAGTVRVSVSDSFTYANYYASVVLGIPISPDTYTGLASGSANWTSAQLANIQNVLSVYSGFVNVSFSTVANYSGNTPANVGNAGTSDINISLIYRTDFKYSGESGINTGFGYTNSALDIVLNVNGFGPNGLSNDYSLGATTFGGHTLMHEIGHSLGLSHPHLAYNSTTGTPTLTSDFSATTLVGFNQLGFVTNSANDMNKEYFTIMSYDDEKPLNGIDTYAQTPMILDVIALQDAYGVGGGTSGVGNDVITPGSSTGVDSYRTYYDTGGIDTVNLVNYNSGAYINLGATIVGASHLVGVSMSIADRQLMVGGGSPQSLRWFYGEFENVIGSSGTDLIIGNNLDNTFTATSGNDSIDGGGGTDTVIYGAKLSEFTGTVGTQTIIQDNILSRYGKETLTNIERLQFTDTMLALDIGPTQTAGSVYMLYQATFNRTPDAGGLGYWIAQVDKGANIITNVASAFVASPEFVAKYGANPTNADYVNNLYQNVLHRSGDAGGIAYWNQQLNIGAVTKAFVLEQFATLVEGAALAAPAIAHGIAYTQWVG